MKSCFIVGALAFCLLFQFPCKADVAEENRGVTPVMLSLGGWNCPSNFDVYGVHLSPIMWGNGPYYMEGVSIGLFDSILSGCGAGVQLSGVGSLMFGHLYGIQIAGLFADSYHLHGVQIAGLYSRAKDASGMQIGIVNYTEKPSGFLLQLGLVNIIEGRVIPIINVGW